MAALDAVVVRSVTGHAIALFVFMCSDSQYLDALVRTSPKHAKETTMLEHGLGSGLSLDSMSLGEVQRIQPREEGSLPRRSAAMQQKPPPEGAG